MKKIISIILLVTMVLSLTSCGEKEMPIEKINLNDYLTYNFAGYDTAGCVWANFDKEKFYLENIDKIQFKDKSTESAYKALYGNDKLSIDLFYDNVCTYSISQSENLKNGDTVFIKWYVNQDVIDKYFNPNTFTSSDIEIKIEGLEQLKYFDPFENYEQYIVYNGINGNGYISTVGSRKFSNEMGEIVLSNPYHGTWRTNLSNGDIETLYFDESMAETVKAYGYCATRTEMKFVCNGFATPEVQKFDNIEKSFYETIDSIAQPEIKTANSFSNSAWKLDAKVKTIATEGYYYFYKTENNVKKSAYIVPVYKIKETIVGQKPDSYTVTWPDDVHYYYYCVRVDVPTVVNGIVQNKDYTSWVKLKKNYPQETIFVSCYWDVKISDTTSYVEEQSYGFRGFHSKQDILDYYKENLVGYKYEYKTKSEIQ